MKVKSFSRVRLLATPWTAAHQAPPSMGFSRQECWSGVPLPFPSRRLGAFLGVQLFQHLSLRRRSFCFALPLPLGRSSADRACRPCGSVWGSLLRLIGPSRLSCPLRCLDSYLLRHCPVLLFFTVALTSLGLLTYHLHFRAGWASSIDPLGKNHHLDNI